MTERTRRWNYVSWDQIDGATPPFAVPGLVHADLTGIVGAPNVGKSGLAVNLLHSALTGGDFLGRPWARSITRAVLLCPEAGGGREYKRRLLGLGLPEEVGRHSVEVAEVPVERGGWARLAEDLETTTLVVLDNLSRLIDINDAKQVLDIGNHLGMLSERAPTVVVAHSSSKASPETGRAPAAPLGMTTISGFLRHEIRLGAAGGGVKLRTVGNDVAEPLNLLLARGELGAGDYSVVEEPEKISRDRVQETLDERAAKARFVTEHCQGLNKSAAAALLASQFGGSPETHKKALQSSGWLGRQLVHEPSSNGWSLAPG